MAIASSRIVLPYDRHGHKAVLFKYQAPTSRFLIRRLARKEDKNLKFVTSSMPSRNDSIEIVSQNDRDTAKQETNEFSVAKKPERKLANTWQKIHGEDDWTGMLDPIDPFLRSELIRYGEMVQACYDAFDSDPFSKYCGSCLHAPSRFFQSVGLTQHGYQVTRYIHATYNINFPQFFKRSLWPEGWSPTANWIGYIAVSDDETSAHLGRRDITIALRGTVTWLEWIADFMYFMKPIALNKIPCPDPRVKVEAGFVHLYTDENQYCRFCKHSTRAHILAEVKRLIQEYEDESLSITITGHSLGSALAILSAYDIAETGADIMNDGRVAPICVFSFSGPRVGNIRFKQRLSELGVKVLRVINVHDKVPKAPGIFFNEHIPAALQNLSIMSSFFYTHVGVELALDHKNSPFLKDTTDLACFHDLEAHLHLLDGCHGKGQRFVLASGRDIALVNKGSDFLKDHLLVPPRWWQSQNRGLVRNHEGHWVQLGRPDFGDAVIQ